MAGFLVIIDKKNKSYYFNIFNKVFLIRGFGVYCVASNGCTWYATYVAPTSPRTYVMTAISSSSTVTSVQGCKSYLQTAYKDYGISFSDIDAIIKYLDYFGQIEKGYTCSGVWTMMPIYYFSDCSTTKPSKKMSR